jgi:hypothetical protein
MINNNKSYIRSVKREVSMVDIHLYEIYDYINCKYKYDWEYINTRNTYYIYQLGNDLKTTMMFRNYN